MMVRPMAFDHRDRLRRASAAAAAERVGAVVVAPSADLVYLTGYDPPPLERLTCLVIRARKDPVLLVPELERPLAEHAGVGKLAEVISWRETEDPYDAVAGVAGGRKHVACSDRMWAAHVLRLQRAMPRTELRSAASILGPLRAIKDHREIALLKRAARSADETFHRIIRERLETMSERRVAERIGELLVETGNERPAFTIVGSGPNSASPHHEPGNRELKAGDAVVMDFGGRTSGYCSDLSRTISIREPRGELREVHEVVSEAQQAAFQAVRPGVPAEEIDRAARDVIEGAGYGDRFVHRTGHGIGLEEHEEPYIVAGNDRPLEPGMCFSIEPGIYLPSSLGVRIEDIVTVTSEGARRLNLASRDLEVVG